MVQAGVLFGGYSHFGVPLERVAETIAAALPEDALAATTTYRFCDERRCIDCPMEVFGLLKPPSSSTATA
jgi:hypothetical protein